QRPIQPRVITVRRRLVVPFEWRSRISRVRRQSMYRQLLVSPRPLGLHTPPFFPRCPAPRRQALLRRDVVREHPYYSKTDLGQGFLQQSFPPADHRSTDRAAYFVRSRQRVRCVNGDLRGRLVGHSYPAAEEYFGALPRPVLLRRFPFRVLGSRPARSV